MKTSPIKFKQVVFDFVLLMAVVFLAGCRTHVSLSEYKDQEPDFTRKSMLKASVALAEATRRLDRDVGLEGCKVRIEMRRFAGGWMVEFIDLPEVPDGFG